MSDLNNLLKSYIESKYGNLHNFANLIDVSYQTLYSAFKRRIEGASIDLLIKICRELRIDMNQLLTKGIIVSLENTLEFKHQNLIEKYDRLTEKERELLEKYIDLLLDTKGVK